MNPLHLILLFLIPFVTPLPLPSVILDLTSTLHSTTQIHLTNARHASSLIHRLHSEITSPQPSNSIVKTPLQHSNYIYLLLKRYIEPIRTILITEYQVLQSIQNSHIALLGEKDIEGRELKEGVKEVKGYIRDVDEVGRIGAEAVRRYREKARRSGSMSASSPLRKNGGGGKFGWEFSEGEVNGT